MNCLKTSDKTLGFPHFNEQWVYTDDNILSMFRDKRHHDTRPYTRPSIAAIVDTGGKGLHVWFYTRDCDPVGIKILTENLGLDASLIGNPEHPCRLPNAIHQKTGKRAELLWCGI